MFPVSFVLADSPFNTDLKKKKIQDLKYITLSFVQIILNCIKDITSMT